MRDEKAGTTLDNWKDDFDWIAAFEYAGPTLNKYGANGSPKVQAVGPCDVSPFTPNDVVEVYKMAEGENDGPSWIMWGQLNDGRHFFLEAGCDYTGWDCQAGGTAYVSTDRNRLVATAMDADARRRFGLETA